MARPKRHADTVLIDAAAGAIAAKGSAAWSLEDVAIRVGMSPAALVKRFGSKRNLLLAVVRAWVESIPDTAVQAGQDPLEALELLVRDTFVGMPETEAAAGHLALLLTEVTDDGIRELVAEGWRRQERLFTLLIGAAQARGLIRGPAADVAGAVLFSLVQGTALRWSVDPQDPLAEVQVGMVRTILEGWR